MTIDEIMSRTLEQWQQSALTRKRLFLERLQLLEDSVKQFDKNITYFATDSHGHCFGFTDTEDKPKFYGSGIGWASYPEEACWFLGVIDARSLVPAETLTSAQEYRAYKDGLLPGLSATIPNTNLGKSTT